MKMTDIKTGDTLLVKTDAFLSKIICRVMKRWGKKMGYDVKQVYSHAARFVWIAEKLYLFGSVENGYNPIIFTRHYDFEKSNFVIMRRLKELSEQEALQTINYCLHLDTLSITYQYWNLFQWLVLVYLNINLFKEDSDKFTYCFEAERKARKNLNPENYTSVYITDIFHLLYDKNYKIIHINE